MATKVQIKKSVPNMSSSPSSTNPARLRTSSSTSSTHEISISRQNQLDSTQYTLDGILSYEKIFGQNMVSTGGIETTRNICSRLGLTRGQRVLDIGCGIGGSAFHMAETYDVHVLGMDLSSNMLKLGAERLKAQPAKVQDRIEFRWGDIVAMPADTFEEGSFDLIYTRDTFIHIEQKLEVFTKCHRWLKKSNPATGQSAGKLFISDYMNRDGELSDEYERYLVRRGYKLTTLNRYQEVLRKCGFSEVKGEDTTHVLLASCERELGRFRDMKDDLLKNGLTQEWFDYEEHGWMEKIGRIKEGSQRWGYLFATA